MSINSVEQIISLNVGGKVFVTTMTTLRADEESKMAHMFSPKNLKLINKDFDGNFFVDLNPTHFQYVLDYLRIIKNLKDKRGAFKPPRSTNQVKGTFRMYGKEYEVKNIWLGKGSDLCSGDELLEHSLPAQTDHLYGVLMQAEYFGLHHLKSLLSLRMEKGNTLTFLMEDILEALGKMAETGETGRPDTGKGHRRSATPPTEQYSD